MFKSSWAQSGMTMTISDSLGTIGDGNNHQAISSEVNNISMAWEVVKKSIHGHLKKRNIKNKQIFFEIIVKLICDQ